MISFAQNSEDILLYRCFRDVTTGFYVDVGAFHPEIAVTQVAEFLNLPKSCIAQFARLVFTGAGVKRPKKPQAELRFS
jgi:hypothetical protein